MKYPIISLLVSLFVIITAFSWAAELPDAVDYFTDNGYGSPVKTMQHPSGEYYKGVTYVAYQGPLEDPYVASYHHETRKWTGGQRLHEDVLAWRQWSLSTRKSRCGSTERKPKDRVKKNETKMT